MVSPPAFWAGSEDWDAAPQRLDGEIDAIRASALLDCVAYARAHGLAGPAEAEWHFLTAGAAAGYKPNPYFDPAWYLAQNPDIAAIGINPLLHYIAEGEAAGRPPSPWFDLAWYATQHTADPGRTLLAHFLARRCSGHVSPLPEFDPAYYLARHPDVAEAGIDPCEHFLLWGYREGRNPSPRFDTRYYIRRHLRGETVENPVLHYRRLRHDLHLSTAAADDSAGQFADTRRFLRPGPDFEEILSLPETARRRARVLAFYLPQFHAIPENDRWWGPGFTEWTSISRGQSRFEGHYQPRIPRDLGHYNLADPAVMRRQAALAHAAGIAGFVHYFYWFNGKRLLEAPIDAMLADPAITMPFCLMWANENWTRRWDGADQEILIAQDWRAEDEPAPIACLLRHMRDPRYIRIDGRPLLMIYRPALIPDTRATIDRWRRLFLAAGEAPILVMAQSFNAIDPRLFGFDAAVEFPPHKLANALSEIGETLHWHDPAATAQVFAYEAIAAASLAEPAPPFALIKTAVPGWDNDARRQGHGLVLHGASPVGYQAWLAALISRAQAHPVFGEAIVCINAWNEWAEGATLEPDIHYGAAFLNATARAVTTASTTDAPVLLLVGHDAFPAGAQQLLLHLARTLRQRHGVRVEIALLGDGALLDAYEAVAPTSVLLDAQAVARHARARGATAAIVNTAAAAAAVSSLAADGLCSVLLLHELPRLLAARNLAAALPDACAAAAEVFVPATPVRDALLPVADCPAGRLAILPQGCYRPAPFDRVARELLRDRLGLAPAAKLVLGAGYADFRKGFDIFLQAWRTARRRDRHAVFCWIGEIDPGLSTHLGPEIDAACGTGSFLLPGHQSDPSSWYAAADVFALPSREDPYPSVVLEAMTAGLPVVAFSGGGGIPSLLAAEDAGRVVPMGDAGLFAGAALALAPHDARRRARIGAAALRKFDFPTYAARLLQAALPAVPRISVVVPNYNYARHLPARLASIFAQTHPVAEVILLDDASTDDSIATARRVAADWGRELRIFANQRNSANVFRQWRRAAHRASGDFVWIAEADDEASPDFLARLAARLTTAPDADLLACDSRAIDTDGELLWADHRAYYADSGAGALAHDAIFPARDFARRFLAERNLLLNVSAVLWRRAPLLASLRRCFAEIETLRVAGDWRLYLDMLAHSTGTVGWVAAPLNAHRRHAGSVTGRLPAESHIAEIRCVQHAARVALQTDAPTHQRQDAYLRLLARDLGVARVEGFAAD